MTYRRISTRARHIFVPYNGKIADITHADTNRHNLDLAAPLSETRTIIAIIVNATRISGSGTIFVYPNEGDKNTQISPGDSRVATVIIAAGMQRLQYYLNVANDDFDLNCLGYVAEA